MNISNLEDRLLTHPDLSGLSPEEQFALIKERARHVVGGENLLAALRQCRKEGRPLRVKYGIDATGRDIHLGHAVPLFLLRRIQNMGHHVVLIIGDFTAKVGDPTGRKDARPILSDEVIRENASRYTEQACKILDADRTEVRFNSEWLGGEIGLADFLRAANGLTVSSAVLREDYKKRRESMSRAELLYSVLMALDSVYLQSELELGGDDQLLNFMDTVEVMRNAGLTPESAITTDILIGTNGDGQKMSKSYGNFVAINEEPEQMFGKLMSIPDELLQMYFQLLTDIRDAEWEELAAAIKSHAVHPMDAKRLLARVVTADIHHDRDAAMRAEQAFNGRVVSKNAPDDLEIIPLQRDATTWVAVLTAVAPKTITSRSRARTLIAQGGVHLQHPDGSETTVLDTNEVPVGTPTTIRIGKRQYVRFVIE